MSDLEKRIRSAAREQAERQRVERQQAIVRETARQRAEEETRILRMRQEQEAQQQAHILRVRTINELDIEALLHETAAGLGLNPKGLKEHIVFPVEKAIMKRPKVSYEFIYGDYERSVDIPSAGDDGPRVRYITNFYFGHALFLSDLIWGGKTYVLFTGIVNDKSLVVGSAWGESKDAAMSKNWRHGFATDLPDLEDPVSVRNAKQFLEKSLLNQATLLLDGGKVDW